MYSKKGFLYASNLHDSFSAVRYQRQRKLRVHIPAARCTHGFGHKREGFEVSVHVAVNTTVRVDATLNVGSVSQSKSVND